MASLVVMGGAGTMVGHQQLDTTLHVPGALSMEKEKWFQAEQIPFIRADIFQGFELLKLLQLLTFQAENNHHAKPWKLKLEKMSSVHFRRKKIMVKAKTAKDGCAKAWL